MKIIFNDFDSDEELGCTEHSEILETLIPAYRQGGHDMFLMKKFSSNPDVNSWQIKGIDVNPRLVEIALAQAVHPYSVAKHAKTQKKPTVSYLKRYSIVEVDFGFYSNAFSHCGQLTKNNSITSALLPGELHKKRPCIVLDASGNRAQVVPMTTNPDAGNNPKNVPISAGSFNHMSERYSEKQSYALLEMIQTVSINRIFPPKANDGKHHPHYSKYGLCSTDRAALRDALAEQYNQDVVNEKVTLQTRFDKLSQEKGKILSANNRIKTELTDIKQQRDHLEALVLKIGDYLDLGKTVEEVESEIDRQF